MFDLLTLQNSNGTRLFGNAGNTTQQDALFLIDYDKNKNIKVTVNNNSVNNIRLLQALLSKYSYQDWHVSDNKNTLTQI